MELFEATAAARESATYGAEETARKGFFTDTTLCIGCKACEVACKEWNQLPADGYDFSGNSYDNTGELSATTWRHVAFVEQLRRGEEQRAGEDPGHWLMSSDVCKHCTHAACLDVCPTGALIRTEHGTVVVQEDVCNGCGYCVPACPFGVIARNESSGHAAKCTLCYDRLKDDETPACAKACPTESIQYGELDELRSRADKRLERVRETAMYADASLYGRDENDGVGGAGAFFLLLDKPEVYGLPPDPLDATQYLGEMWRSAAWAAAALLGATVVASFARNR
jgi:formate dehydrogenase iron-sulfur subunit